MKNESSVRTAGTANSRIRLIAVLAILAAASVVLGKFMQIRIGDTIRISLENLPIIFAGTVFGPISGAAVGIVADLIGCVAMGYAINPIITAAAALIGAVSGLMGMLTCRTQKPALWRVLLPVAAAHMIGSMGVKSLGLWLAYSTPMTALLSTRVPIYLCNIAAEAVIIWILLKSEAIRSALRGFGKSL